LRPLGSIKAPWRRSRIGGVDSVIVRDIEPFLGERELGSRR